MQSSSTMTFKERMGPAWKFKGLKNDFETWTYRLTYEEHATINMTADMLDALVAAIGGDLEPAKKEVSEANKLWPEKDR